MQVTLRKTNFANILIKTNSRVTDYLLTDVEFSWLVNFDESFSRKRNLFRAHLNNSIFYTPRGQVGPVALLTTNSSNFLL